MKGPLSGLTESIDLSGAVKRDSRRVFLNDIRRDVCKNKIKRLPESLVTSARRLYSSSNWFLLHFEKSRTIWFLVFMISALFLFMSLQKEKK